MKQKKGGTEIAFRPQNIIEARFDLTNRQNDVLDLLFGMVGTNGDSTENTRYTIYPKDVKKLYDIKNQSHAYEYLIKGVKEFRKKGGIGGFQLKIDDNTDVWYAWFTRIAYHKSENEEKSRIEIDIHPDLKKMIEEAKQGLYYRIGYSLNLDNKFSKRLYYYLKDHLNFKMYSNAQVGKFKISFDELYKMLQCPKSYKKPALFRNKVLEIAYREINGNTDINFEYKEINGKTERGQNTVVEIEFIVTPVPKKKDIVEQETCSTNEKIHSIINLFSCSEKEAESIYNTAIKNNRSFEELVQYLDYAIKQKPKNKIGYVLSLLKNGLNKPTQNNFCNFGNQRSYSHEEIAEIEQKALKRNIEN